MITKFSRQIFFVLHILHCKVTIVCLLMAPKPHITNMFSALAYKVFMWMSFEIPPDEKLIFNRRSCVSVTSATRKHCHILAKTNLCFSLCGWITDSRRPLHDHYTHKFGHLHKSSLNNISVLWRLERHFYHTGREVSNCTLMIMPWGTCTKRLKACLHYEPGWTRLNAVSVQTESNPDRTGLLASACMYSKKQLIRV